MGTVRHLVSPNQFHYAHIGEWARAFPDATTWASPGVRRRPRAACRHRFREGPAAEPSADWRRDIDQTLFPGGYFREFIFFHEASATLILTDAIFNIELDRIGEPWRTVTRLSGMHHPNGQIFFDAAAAAPAAPEGRAAFARIRSWQPQRILLSHGRCFDAPADEAIKRIFGA